MFGVLQRNRGFENSRCWYSTRAPCVHVKDEGAVSRGGWLLPLFKIPTARPFFARKIEKLLVNDKITSFVSNNNVSQILFQLLQTTIKFEKLLG